MKFGKLDDISRVDFRLPEDAPRTLETLRRVGTPEGVLHSYVGATGWNMREWVGTVYPAGAKARDYLRHYARQFNTIELNTTHYRIPTADLIQRWYDESAADFRFCPKVPQTISHSRDLGVGTDQIDAFCNAVAGLQEKLGCCFVQLPPYFGLERLALLTRFLHRWPGEIPLAVELRHESWFQHPEAWEQAVDLFTQQSVSTVITDVAGRRDVLHMSVTTDTAMIRFVGNGLHPSDYRRIDEWMQRLQHWRRNGLSTCYFFTHEPDNILAPELARYLSDNLHRLEQIQGRGPHFTEGNRQISLF